MSTTPSSEKASPPFFVEHDYEGVVDQITDLVFKEDSDAWLRIGEVLERIAPGLSPFDRREAVAEVLQPIRKVIEDEFC